MFIELTFNRGATIPTSTRKVRSVLTERDRLLTQRQAAARICTSECSRAPTIPGNNLASTTCFRHSSLSEQVAAKASRHD